MVLASHASTPDSPIFDSRRLYVDGCGGRGEPVGVGRHAEQSVARWPQMGTRQLLAFPLVFVLLVASMALSIPFGIASYHFGL